MQDRSGVAFAIVVLLLAAGLIVLLGIQAKSAWVSVLAVVGLLASLYSLSTGRAHQYGGFWFGLIVSLAALAAAVWLSHLAGRFWWTPLFILISILFLANGAALVSEYEQPAGSASIIIGILLFAFAILGPWLLYGPISGATRAAAAPTIAPTVAVLPTAAPPTAAPTAAPTAVPTPIPTAPPAPSAAAVERGSFFPGMWDFLLGSVKSGWGIFYLALVILLGRIWLGKWGWLITPILLILAAGGLAWLAPASAEALTGFFSARPLEHLTAFLGWSARQLGSAAWGALLAGVGLVVLLLPAYITMYSANRSMVTAQKVGEVFGTTFAANLLRRSNASSPYTGLVSILTVAASIYGFVLVWKALAALSAVSGAPAFPLLGIADVSLPRWKPVMQWQYFLNAGIYALISLILTAIQRRMGLAMFAINWFVIVLGAALLGLFVPAGVVDFLAGQSLALGVVAPLSLLKKTRLAPPARPVHDYGRDQFQEELRRRNAARESQRAIDDLLQREADRRAGRPIPEPPPAPQEDIPIIVGGKYMAEEEEEVEEEQAEEQVEGELIFEHTEPLIDLTLDSQGQVVFMDQLGDAWQCDAYGSLTKLIDVNMIDPLGMAFVSGGRLAAVDLTGEVFFSSGEPESIQTSAEIHAFTVNSFGTILAYINPQSTSLRGLILAAGKEQEFIDCGERLTDLSFSADNRYLGIGTEDSGILIFDMAKRQITQKLAQSGLRSVIQIVPGDHGGWVAAYESGKVACWDSQGDLLGTFSVDGKITSLAYDTRYGKVACGTDRGELIVTDEAFDIIKNPTLSDEEIVAIVFDPGGYSLVTAGEDGAIRRITV